MDRPRRWTAALAVLLLATLSGLRAAASEAPSGVDVVHYDRVEPSRTAEYEVAIRAWAAAFREGALGQKWAWRAYCGPDSTYAYRSSLPDFAFLDSENDRRQEMISVLGEERSERLRARTVAIRSHHSELLRKRPELGYRPARPQGADPAFLRVGAHRVRPAMTERFEAVLRRMTAALSRSRVALPLEVEEVRFGPGLYRLVVAAASAEELAAQPRLDELLRRSLGEEAARELLAEWRQCVSEYTTANWVFRPDLSYLPGNESDPGATDSAGTTKKGPGCPGP